MTGQKQHGHTGKYGQIWEIDRKKEEEQPYAVPGRSSKPRVNAGGSLCRSHPLQPGGGHKKQPNKDTLTFICSRQTKFSSSDGFPLKQGKITNIPHMEATQQQELPCDSLRST